MIQIRQSKRPATVIRLDSVFAHGDGLPVPRHSIAAECRSIATGGASKIGNTYGETTAEIKADMGRR
jgi:hypothetical protein